MLKEKVSGFFKNGVADLLKNFEILIRKGNTLLVHCSGFLILVMGLSLFYEVVCRYVLNSPSIWAHETAIYLYTWAMLAAGAYTLQEEKHVRIELLVEHLSPKIQSYIKIVTSLCGTVFCSLVAFQAYEMIKVSLRFSKVSPTLLKVPLWVPQAALLAGFSLLTLQFLFIALFEMSGLGKENPGRC